MTCLTETAATHAAAEKLKIDSVVDDLGRGNNGMKRKMHLVKVGYDALRDTLGRTVGDFDVIYRIIIVINGRIEARDINAADVAGFFKKLRLTPAVLLSLMDERQKLVIHLLALTEKENVHEIRHGLGVQCCRAADEHKRQKLSSFGTMDRQSRHVHHVKHCGVSHLVAD